ncbi:MAG: asparaginase domain-containing protein [Phycisphaerales bacterium]
MRHITLITTGGTIEKTYNEVSGSLENTRSIVRRMLRRLRLEDTDVGIIELMSKDSLVMTDDDRERIVDAVRAAGGGGGVGGVGGAAVSAAQPLTAGIVILHGTDTLCTTGERLVQALPAPRVPIVLTGAMRPFEMTRSDALQNLTEALFATDVRAPGIYVAAHGRCLPFPGVRKDRDRGTFVAG